MALWRLGRPASVNDCVELFGVSEGFVDLWTDRVLKFIRDVFGRRLYGREWCTWSHDFRFFVCSVLDVFFSPP